MYLDITIGFFFGTFDQSDITFIPIPLADAGGFKILFFKR
jgi:hypothetical protein